MGILISSVFIDSLPLLFRDSRIQLGDAQFKKHWTRLKFLYICMQGFEGTDLQVCMLRDESPETLEKALFQLLISGVESVEFTGDAFSATSSTTSCSGCIEAGLRLSHQPLEVAQIPGRVDLLLIGISWVSELGSGGGNEELANILYNSTPTSINFINQQNN